MGSQTLEGTCSLQVLGEAVQGEAVQDVLHVHEVGLQSTGHGLSEATKRCWTE
jgi:hypothetical protein